MAVVEWAEAPKTNTSLRCHITSMMSPLAPDKKNNRLNMKIFVEVMDGLIKIVTQGVAFSNISRNPAALYINGIN